MNWILSLSGCSHFIIAGTRYQSLDRGGLVDPHDREFMPIREPRDRSRERSMDRGLYLEDDLYGRPRQSECGFVCC